MISQCQRGDDTEAEWSTPHATRPVGPSASRSAIQSDILSIGLKHPEPISLLISHHSSPYSMRCSHMEMLLLVARKGVKLEASADIYHACMLTRVILIHFLHAFSPRIRLVCAVTLDSVCCAIYEMYVLQLLVSIMHHT
jgi:hypothetical protein